jgi:putative glutathione S-transferase
LGKQRYIAGGQLTESDIRLFMTLIRFDEVTACRACKMYSALLLAQISR